jgi:hypothetical protein
MSIVIALMLGTFFGVLIQSMWRVEELEALSKANMKLIEERDQARQLNQAKAMFHPKPRVVS